MVMTVIIIYDYYHCFDNDDNDSDGNDDAYDEDKDEVEDAAATFTMIGAPPVASADAVTFVASDVVDVDACRCCSCRCRRCRYRCKC